MFLPSSLPITLQCGLEEEPLNGKAQEVWLAAIGDHAE